MSRDANRYLKDQLFLAGVAFLTLSLMSLFFLSLAWLAGGDAYMASIYGKESMAALLAVAAVGGAMMAIFRDSMPATQN